MAKGKFKTFGGNRSLDEIERQCKAQGVVFDDYRYRMVGDDFVRIHGGGAWVLFNTFNGNFFGQTPDGEQFASDDKRDGTPWFDALLNFFYREAA